jgi:hypothetical protein
VTRQLSWLWMAAVGGLVWGGCKDSAGMKGYTQPLRVVERTEMYLNNVKTKMAADDYAAANEPEIGMAEELIRQVLPYSLQSKMEDGSTKQEALAKLTELQKVFAEQVHEPAWASPPDLGKARPGVEACLKLVGELKNTLGG